MKINHIKIKNFRPFYLEHNLDLSSSGKNNLTLIFAENMRGKTAILNAIRWALYGHAYNRLRETVPIFRTDKGDQLLNKVAVRDGIYEMEIELKFEHQGRNYELKRSAKATGNPKREGEFILDRHLLIDNSAVAREQVDARIFAVLHEDISRFSLFDGEMLGEYEKLLTDREQEIVTVKDAIEKTLGLPALTRSRTYLADIKTEFEKTLNAQLRREKRNEETISRIEEIQDNLESAQRDLGKLKETLSKYIQEKTDAKNDLRKHEEISKVLAHISDIENEITNADRELINMKSTIQETLQKYWWIALKRKLDDIKNDIQDRLVHEVEAKKSDLMKVQLKTSIEQKKCVLCGTNAGKSVGTRIKKRLMELETKQNPSNDRGYENRLMEQVDFLGKLETDKAVERLINSDSRIMQLETFRTDKIERATSMRRELGDFNKDDQESKVKRFSEAEENVRDVQNRIERKEQQIKDLNNERESEQKKVNKASGADNVTHECARLASLIHDAFNLAIDSFRNEAKNAVSKAADEIFKVLTTEKAYQGLKINENYGLTILDSHGHEVSGRSAGAEQIVALSLIGGLNRSAVAGDSPVIMDTNFGRLDRAHRENVLKWVSKLNQQVVLLVHSGELEEHDLTEFGIDYSRAYRIVRINEWQSEIEQSNV